MSRWYHLEKGKTCGPFSLEEIEAKINDKTLGPLDLVFFEGGKEWLPLSEYSEFREILDSTAYSKAEEDWVVLVREGSDYKQEGPYSRQVILEMLESGRLKFDDFLWKDGMQEWYRIRSIKEFNSSAEDPVRFDNLEPQLNTEEIYKEDGESLLKNVEVLDKTNTEKIIISELKEELGENTESIDISELTPIINTAPEPPEQDNVASGEKPPDRLPTNQPVRKTFKPNYNTEVIKDVDADPGSEQKRPTEKSPSPAPLSGSKALKSMDELRKSLDELASGIKINEVLSRKNRIKVAHKRQDSTPSKVEGSQSVEETRVTKNAPTAKKIVRQATSVKEDEFDPDSTRIVDLSEISLEAEAAPTPLAAQPQRRAGGNVAKIIKKQRPLAGQGGGGLFTVLSNELNALFPKGSLLRLVMFLIVIIGVSSYLFYSSYKDREADRVAQERLQKSLNAIKEKELQAQRKREAIEAKKKAQEMREKAELMKEPQQLKVKIKDLDSRQGKLLITSDASKHYNFYISIEGKAGTVLGRRGFFKKLTLPAGEPVSLYFDQVGMEFGDYIVRVKVGNLVKERAFFLGRQSKTYNVKIRNHRKEIAIWHQKERRALYSSVNSYKQLSKQVSTLLPFREENPRRWWRSLRNWKKKLASKRSAYINEVKDLNSQNLVHPKLWYDLRQIELKLLKAAEAKSSTIATFEGIITDLNNFSNRVNNLTLW